MKHLSEMVGASVYDDRGILFLQNAKIVEF